MTGEVKLLRNGPNGSMLVVFTDDYRTYIVKHLHSVAVRKALLGLCTCHASLLTCNSSQRLLNNLNELCIDNNQNSFLSLEE